MRQRRGTIRVRYFSLSTQLYLFEFLKLLIVLHSYSACTLIYVFEKKRPLDDIYNIVRIIILLIFQSTIGLYHLYIAKYKRNFHLFLCIEV